MQVDTLRHGRLVFAGGAKDVLLVLRVSEADGALRLLSTHRMPAAKGVMLRYVCTVCWRMLTYAGVC